MDKTPRKRPTIRDEKRGLRLESCFVGDDLSLGIKFPSIIGGIRRLPGKYFKSIINRLATQIRKMFFFFQHSILNNRFNFRTGSYDVYIYRGKHSLPRVVLRFRLNLNIVFVLIASRFTSYNSGPPTNSNLYVF